MLTGPRSLLDLDHAIWSLVNQLLTCRHVLIFFLVIAQIAQTIA
jgi:hypothetical protein